MKTIRVSLKNRSYDIVIATGALRQLGAHLRRLKVEGQAYVVTNNRVKRLCAPGLTRALRAKGYSFKFKCVADSESSKSIKVLSALINDLAVFGKKKKVFIVALGGGVIGDLAGFLAAIYKRGIPYIQIPTTLLAQVDSAIGGKTGIDLPQGKNLIGAFYQPRIVVSDLNLLKTLDDKQIRNGLSEVIKYAVIKDPALFEYLEDHCNDILAKKTSALEFIVSRCSSIKAAIVEKDEREEKGLRTILNFGHTLGHAIEAAAEYKKYTHGEAVALGMIGACDISRNLGLTGDAVKERIESLIKRSGLPHKIKGIGSSRILDAHYHDKKFSGAKNKFVLIKGIGRVSVVESIDLELIISGLRNLLRG